MKTYKAVAEIILEGDVICSFAEGEVDAETSADALREAVEGVYHYLRSITYHKDVCKGQEAGCVYWTNPSGQRVTERITVKEAQNH